MERLSALWRTRKPKPSSPAPRVVEQEGLSCLIRPWPLSGESDQRKSTGEEGGLRQLCRGGIFALWVIRSVWPKHRIIFILYGQAVSTLWPTGSSGFVTSVVHEVSR